MQCIENSKTLTTTALTLETHNSLTFPSSSSIFDYYSDDDSLEYDDCVWRRAELPACDYVIYAFVVPSLAFFGLCANFINAIVFMRPKMTPSAFTYLAVLSWLDCISCLLITLTALSRSVLYSSTFWMVYDFQWQTPLFGITTGAGNLILACVSLDRFIYLRWGIPNGTPKFCKRAVARRVIVVCIVISIMVNMPYFFVFVVNEDATFETTDFYFSQYYMIHNWFSFILLTVLPALFLLIGNAAILIAFCKWTKQSKKCQQTCSKYSQTTQNRYRHQMKLTVTIVIVISLYLVGELPAHLTSRKSAVNLLYGGDVTKVDYKVMQRLEVICITLNSIQLSMNIIVYAVINPTFIPEFFSCLKGASDVCFKFMGFTAIGNCWGKLCHSHKRKAQTNATDCERSNEHCNTNDNAWQCRAETAVRCEGNNACNVMSDAEISIITSQYLRTSFENPTFVKETV